jgi:hypothetical protein
LDAAQLKAVIDLHELFKNLTKDRPPVGTFLKEVQIDPQVMSDYIRSAAIALHTGGANLEYFIQVINAVFKSGITLGYHYAKTKEMQKIFQTGEFTP